MGAEPATAAPALDSARTARLAALAVVLLALLPSSGTLDAPWIAEDASVLARVASDGAWADWGRSWGGVLHLRFWRPLVSASWALQEAWTGIAPAPLRLFNLSLHALTAWLVFACARRLGAHLPGALVAGAWIALFPEQGGTCTWLSGRTDLLSGVFLVASAHASLGKRPVLSAPLAFLACAAKEFGFLAPLWCALLALARGDGRRELVRRVWPSAAAVLVAFVWRRLALGRFAGGYEADLPGLAAGVGGASLALVRAAWPALVSSGALLAAGLAARSASARGVAAASAAALAAAVPLYPLLADGFLEPENRRLLYVPACALALAAGLAWSRRAATRARGRVLGALACALLAARLVLAWTDTHDWARSARAGEADVARARAAVAGAEPAPRPVYFAGFPASRFGAYSLGFGLAARFRAPFPASPRPVWPWRLVFVHQAQRERAPLVPFRADGSAWPLDDAREVPELAVRDGSGAPLERVELDERVVLPGEDRSPRLVVEDGPPGAPLELVIHCELGYEPVPLGALDARGAAASTLKQLLAATNGIASAGQVLAWAADLGAAHAYLELRALDASARPAAASRWIEVSWPPELLGRALSAR